MGAEYFEPQLLDYDSDGEYVRTWIPELKNVPGEFIHEPHKMNFKQKTLFDVKINSITQNL